MEIACIESDINWRKNKIISYGYLKIQRVIVKVNMYTSCSFEIG